MSDEKTRKLEREGSPAELYQHYLRLGRKEDADEVLASISPGTIFEIPIEFQVTYDVLVHPDDPNRYSEIQMEGTLEEINACLIKYEVNGNLIMHNNVLSAFSFAYWSVCFNSELADFTKNISLQKLDEIANGSLTPINLFAKSFKEYLKKKEAENQLKVKEIKIQTEKREAAELRKQADVACVESFYSNLPTLMMQAWQVYSANKGLPRKEFAQIVGNNPFRKILFQAYSLAWNYEELVSAFIDLSPRSRLMIAKELYGGTTSTDGTTEAGH